MIKIDFIIERIIFFVIGAIFLSFIVISKILDFDNDIFWNISCSICSLLSVIVSFTYHITYDKESLTIHLFYFKRTYQFKELKNVYVFMYRLYYISFFDSRSIAIPGLGEKEKLNLLFEEIRKNQPSLKVFE